MKPTAKQLSPLVPLVPRQPIVTDTPTTNKPVRIESVEERRDRVHDRLHQLGVKGADMARGETKYLPQLIHPSEEIGGVVYGNADEGKIMLAATDRRLLYVDTKPFFKKAEDISYDSVGGITFEWVVFRGTLILQTRVGDIKLRIRNRDLAESFRNYVESRCIERRLSYGEDS